VKLSHIALYLASCLLSAACLSPKASDDPVLDLYARNEVSIAPADSIDLSPYKILLPGKAISAGDWLIVQKYRSNNFVDLVNVEADSVIHCFKKGRGPEELVKPFGKIQHFKGSVYFYDFDLKRIMALDIAQTIGGGEQKASVFKAYNTNAGPVMTSDSPDKLAVFDGGVLATGRFTPAKWYGILSDDCALSSSVNLIETAEPLSDRALSTLCSASVIAVSPNASKAVVAMTPAADISLCDLSPDGKEVKEYRRISLNEPEVLEGETTGPVISYKENSRKAFLDVQATDSFVCLLYSGSFVTAPDSNNAHHLIVMDWEGNPVKSYYLERGCGAIHLDGDTLTCSSMYPKPMVYRYELK